MQQAQRKQLLHFLAHLAFEFKQTLVTDGMALGSIRMELAPIQANIAQVQGPRFLSHQQDLDKHSLEVGQKGLPKVGEGVVVGMQATCDEAKRNRLVRRGLDFARTKHAGGVAIQEQAQQNFGIDGLAPHRSIARIDFAQVQLRDDRDNEARQVIGRQTFSHGHSLMESRFVIDSFEFWVVRISLPSLE